MEKFTKCCFDKDYQHKDSTDSRLKTDLKCLNLIEEFFQQYDPFPEEIDKLINIANGMSGSEEASCHNAFEQGVQIMKDISGTNFKELKLSRSKFVKTISGSNSKICVDKETYKIDIDVLFHTICIIKRNNEEMQEYLKWELSPFPQAFFNAFGMLKNTKSDLYSIFRKVSLNVRDPVNSHYVVDGGFLLHKVKWTLGQVFSSIMTNYIKFIQNHYGHKSIVIFDGYETVSTKESERIRRASHAVSADVHFDETMPLKIAQEKFLLNKKKTK